MSTKDTFKLIACEFTAVVNIDLDVRFQFIGAQYKYYEYVPSVVTRQQAY